MFSKSLTTDWTQWSKIFYTYWKTLNFVIIIKRSIYYLIGIRSNIIYHISIFKQSYKYKIQNACAHFDLYVITCILLIVNWSIDRNKILFSYILFVYNSTIKPLFNLYMISLFTRDDSPQIFNQNYVKFFEKNMCLKR